MPKYNPSPAFIEEVKKTDALINIPFSSVIYLQLSKKDFLLANESVAYINLINNNTDNIRQIKSLDKFSGSRINDERMSNR